jgi:hypothetical protein
MSGWVKNHRVLARKRVWHQPTHAVRLVVTRYMYDVDANGLTYQDILGIDELVLKGSPANNTPINLPSHTALLQLFVEPQVSDIFSINVVNSSEYSFDLVLMDPSQMVLVGAAATIKLYFEVVNSTPVTGVAEVRMLTHLIGATSGTSTQLGSPVPGQHATDISTLEASISRASMGTAFQLNQLLEGIQAGETIPASNAGRTFTFTNTTAETPLNLYMTLIAPIPAPVTLLTKLPVGAVYILAIPKTLGFTGNFSVWPTADISTPGFSPGLGTLLEFGLNQYWNYPGVTQLRDTINQSTVPPGLGTGCKNGPHSACVQTSIAAGYTRVQANGYSVGMSVTFPINAPASPDFLPQPSNTTCAHLHGDCAQSVTYPLQTSVPREQTSYAAGNYEVDFIDPVA